jgi:ABC-type transporter Mla maintaining outer membrane lipid asymmetry ATPase subunit MlaF
MGTVKTGVILKDVSLEVHGGEVLAILGSKGETQFFPQITEIKLG